MKKILKVCLLTAPCLSFLTTNAQWSATTVPPHIKVTNTAANVGIGDYPNINTPIDPLTIGGDISLYPISASADRRINGRSLSSMLQLSANSNITDGSCIQLYGRSHPTATGMIDFTASTFTGSAGNIAFRFNTHNGATSNPLFTLYRNGSADLYGYNFTFNPSVDAERTINAKTTTSLFSINANLSANDGPSIKMYGRSHATGPGMMTFTANALSADPNQSAYRFDVYSPSSGTSKTIMVMYKGGNMEVCGRIRAKEIVVETGWCDYVFNDNYRLRSLNELEQYIKAYRHLPEIPTTEEITTNGAPIGEMTSKLLLKVEELTLYMLQLKKQNDALQAEINILKNKI